MAEHSQDLRLRAAVAAARAELEGSAEYERGQREARSGRQPPDGPGPLEFDEGGFPIARPIPRFVRRVRRLFRDE